MKKIFIYAAIILSAMTLLSFSEGTTKKKYLVEREWMSDALLQIRPTYYNYDADGRMIRSESQNPDTFVTTNTYTSTGIVTVSGLSTASFKDTIVYTLGSDGHVAKDNRGNTYGFNKDGKMTMGVDGEAYSWYDGDMMTREYYDGSQIHTIHYTYTSIEDMRDYGDAAWGMRSKHLVETVNDGKTTVTHRYTLDPLGRPKLDSAGANVYHYFYRAF